MKMKNLVKKGSAIALAAVLLLPGVSLLKANAANAIDTEQPCTLTIGVAVEEYDYVNGFTDMEIPVALYKVADVDAGGNFTAVGAFAEMDFSVLSDTTTADDWMKLAEQANGKLSETVEPTASTVVKTEEGADEARAAVENLEVGLYLVVPEDCYNPDYSYHVTFTPYLTALPTNAYALPEYGTGEDAWDYKPAIGLKAGTEEQFGKLSITKILTNYNATLGPVTFVFEIEGKDALGEVIYSNVVTTTHTQAGNETVTLENLPAAMNVTVKEVYSGASYEASSAELVEGLVINSEAAVEAGLEEAKASFTNQYDGGLKSGYGVNNHFESNGEGGWIWSSSTQNVE